MRTIQTGIFIGALIAIGFIFYVLNHVGAGKEVRLWEEDMPARKFVYAEHVGSYHKTVTAIEKVEAWFKSQNLNCRLSMGEYLEDTNVVDEERLRSHGGCLVEEWPNQMPTEFKTKEIPAGRYLRAEFDGSPAIGPFKVYPAAEEYLRKLGKTVTPPTLETYEILSPTQMKTLYDFKM